MTATLAIGALLISPTQSFAYSDDPPPPPFTSDTLPPVQVDANGAPISGTGTLQPAAAVPTYNGPGFIIDGGDGRARNRENYTIKLVSNTRGNIELYRPAAVSVAAYLRDHTGLNVTVASGTLPDTAGTATQPGRPAAAGEILISVDGRACPGAPGCGTYAYQKVSGERLIVSGRVWILPTMDTEATADQKRQLLSDEIGHALGLSHYNELYHNQYQMMLSDGTGWGPVGKTYQDGDLNGFHYLSPLNTYGMGWYDQASGQWRLRDSINSTDTQYHFAYGSVNPTHIPLVGDWDGNGQDSVGYYQTSDATVRLTNTNADSGGTNYQFVRGPVSSGSKPVVGDWDGDGKDSVGYYTKADGTFHLRNALNSGSSDYAFAYGDASSDKIPLAGDWDGDGKDSVGLYDPSAGTIHLTNSVLASGVTNYAYTFGPTSAGSEWTPVAGDWNCDGADTLALYNANSHTLSIKNSHTSGYSDFSRDLSPGGANNKPLAGNFSGECSAD